MSSAASLAADFPLAPPPALVWEGILRTAFEEDLGRAGDLTTDAIIPATAVADAVIAVRKPAVIAGLAVAERAFTLFDPSVRVELVVCDGAAVEPGTVLARVSGPARSLLTAERTGLNLLGRLSGIATATASVVAEVAGTRTQVVCTRKTTRDCGRWRSTLCAPAGG